MISELDDADKVLLQRAIEQLTAANAIMRFISDHFRDKYGLTPQNQITPDGRIVTIGSLDGTEELSNIFGKS